MTPAVKAALLSGLIFPGIGQLTLGAIKRGWLIIITTLVSLLTLIYLAVQEARLILDKLQQNNQLIDMQAIRQAAAQSSGFSDNAFMNSLLIIVILCWLFSIVDAYRLAQKTNN